MFLLIATPKSSYHHSTPHRPTPPTSPHRCPITPGSTERRHVAVSSSGEPKQCPSESDFLGNGWVFLIFCPTPVPTKTFLRRRRRSSANLSVVTKWVWGRGSADDDAGTGEGPFGVFAWLSTQTQQQQCERYIMCRKIFRGSVFPTSSTAR